MAYRTKTYIAADWDGDKDAVEQLHKWNDSNYWALHFNDAHDLKQARDDSLNCSIKKSLSDRLDVSMTFVLIVGNTTKTVRSGSCQYCKSLNSHTGACARGYSVDYRSYIEFECEKAVRDGLKIVVLYNATTVDKNKCPDAVKYTGTHTAMCYYEDSRYYWDYNAVKTALSKEKEQKWLTKTKPMSLLMEIRIWRIIELSKCGKRVVTSTLIFMMPTT